MRLVFITVTHVIGFGQSLRIYVPAIFPLQKMRKYKSCSIQGADDTGIQEPVANPIHLLLQKTSMKAIFTTGSKAAVLYEKYCLSKTGIPALALPSTSPANCRMTYDNLKQAYAVILPYLR